ncbi:hypothetical protein NXX09_19735 [Bacteroides uniformis]|nr:hypothetical protein [Bacteroides uniformis]
MWGAVFRDVSNLDVTPMRYPGRTQNALRPFITLAGDGLPA